MSIRIKYFEKNFLFVAQADEKYPYLLFVFQRVNKFCYFMVYVVVYHFYFST